MARYLTSALEWHTTVNLLEKQETKLWPWNTTYPKVELCIWTTTQSAYMSTANSDGKEDRIRRAWSRVPLKYRIICFTTDRQGPRGACIWRFSLSTAYEMSGRASVRYYKGPIRLRYWVGSLTCSPAVADNLAWVLIDVLQSLQFVMPALSTTSK